MFPSISQRLLHEDPWEKFLLGLIIRKSCSAFLLTTGILKKKKKNPITDSMFLVTQFYPAFVLAVGKPTVTL